MTDQPSKTDSIEIAERKDCLVKERRNLQDYQDSLKSQLAAGDEFLREFDYPPLSRAESVAGVCADRFDLFADNRDWDDCMALAMMEYIQSHKGKGACHNWLHNRLCGLTHGSGILVWDEDATWGAIWMVLRYIRITDATIAQGERMVAALKRYPKDDSDFDWDKAACQFFATLDDDPFWAAHPIAGVNYRKKRVRLHD